MYTLTVTETFDAAHRLYGYEGKCANLHGHTWKVQIVIEECANNPLDKLGMLVDFGEIKNVVKGLDHICLLRRDDPLIKSIQTTVPIYLLDGNPTAEKIAEHLGHLVLHILHDKKLKGCWIYITVWETPNNVCEYSISS